MAAPAAARLTCTPPAVAAVIAVVVLAAVILVLWVVGPAVLRRASGDGRIGEKGRG